MDWLTWLGEHEAQVRRMCRRIAGNRPDLADDMYGECVDRLARVFELYCDGFDNALDTYVFANLKWYAYKAKVRWTQAVYIEDDPPDVTSNDFEVADSIEYLRGRMDPVDFTILWLKFVDGMTHEDVGDIVGFGRETARKRFNAALAHARECLALDS